MRSSKDEGYRKMFGVRVTGLVRRDNRKVPIPLSRFLRNYKAKLSAGLPEEAKGLENHKSWT